MGSLPLNSLHIRGFRAFRDTRVEKLKRVNLIVGKNNVGKTYLLEAVRLYMNRGNPSILSGMLSDRDEMPQRYRAVKERDDWPESVRNLFFGRPTGSDSVPPFRIGPDDSYERTLEVRFAWHVVSSTDDGARGGVIADSPDLPTLLMGAEVQPVLQVMWGDEQIALIPVERLDEFASRRVLHRRDPNSKPVASCQFVRSGGPQSREIGILWDNVALTDLEEDVVAALRIIDNRIERLALVGTAADGGYSRQRIAAAKLVGRDQRISLRSMGEGTNRMFGLVLALVNAKDGVLLIDEIENGFHYTVLPRLWELVMTTAERLNVQVFATTHSWDCIEAFQAVADEARQEDVMLIRLESRDGIVRPVVFIKDELDIVTRDEIEVR